MAPMDDDEVYDLLFDAARRLSDAEQRASSVRQRTALAASVKFLDMMCVVLLAAGENDQNGENPGRG